MGGDDILAVAEQQFAAKLAVDEMYCVPVPEWGAGGEALNLYFKPSTLAEQDKLFTYVQTGSLEGLAQLIIVRARDVDGNKLFKQAHKLQLLTKVDPKILSRISVELAKQEGADLDAVEKKF